MLHAATYILPFVVIVGLVTSSDGTRVVENDATVSIIGACLRCKNTNGVSRNDCQMCYGTSTEIRLEVAKRQQSAASDVDRNYASPINFSGRQRAQV